MPAANPFVGGAPAVGTPTQQSTAAVGVPAGGVMDDGIPDGTEFYVAGIVIIALLILMGFSKAGFRTVIAANVKVGR